MAQLERGHLPTSLRGSLSPEATQVLTIISRCEGDVLFPTLICPKIGCLWKFENPLWKYPPLDYLFFHENIGNPPRAMVDPAWKIFQASATASSSSSSDSSKETPQGRPELMCFTRFMREHPEYSNTWYWNGASMCFLHFLRKPIERVASQVHISFSLLLSSVASVGVRLGSAPALESVLLGIS